MPKKIFRKRVARKGGRRLQPVAAVGAAAIGAAKVIKRGYNAYQARKTRTKNAASKAFVSRMTQSDNIMTAKAVVIGKQRPISFQEKVSRTVRPPLLFKRNYAFSAECVSGRKAMFSIDMNVMTSNDLQIDILNYKQSLYTDTATIDSTISNSTAGDAARFYVDKLTEKLQMVNSSSNSITGKIHLFAHRRDSGQTYSVSNSIINPVNLLQYYSTVAPAPAAADIGGGQTVGNGWVFVASGGPAGNNWQFTYNMPGSSINSTGVAGYVDPQLGFTSSHVKDGLAFWFRKVSTSNFALKPGQQFNSSFVFNDLPIVDREEQQNYIHIAGVTYTAVVEFMGGIVGDSTAVTGNNVVSTGDCQLSVIRESVRMLGMKNTYRSKVLLQTSPLAQIAIGSQVIINSDTGVGLSGAVIDA